MDVNWRAPQKGQYQYARGITLPLAKMSGGPAENHSVSRTIAHHCSLLYEQGMFLAHWVKRTSKGNQEERKAIGFLVVVGWSHCFGRPVGALMRQM